MHSQQWKWKALIWYLFTLVLQKCLSSKGYAEVRNQLLKAKLLASPASKIQQLNQKRNIIAVTLHSFSWCCCTQSEVPQDWISVSIIHFQHLAFFSEDGSSEVIATSPCRLVNELSCLLMEHLHTLLLDKWHEAMAGNPARLSVRLGRGLSCVFLLCGYYSHNSRCSSMNS